MIGLLITCEHFISLKFPGWEKDEPSKFDFKLWRRRPLNTWPMDNAEAKSIANTIATYNFNNYQVPKLYHNLDEEYNLYPDQCFMVHDPIFLAGMAWKGTYHSIKYPLGMILSKLSSGEYPPEGGMGVGDEWNETIGNT